MQNGSLRGPREDRLPNIAILEDDGLTALHEAASIGDEKTLQTLLNVGSNRNAKDKKHGNTPLHEAAWRGYSRSVKLLCSLPPLPKNVKQKTGINESRGAALHSTLLGTRNAGGFSALHLASQNGHNQSVREILLAGADPDVQNNYGDTPLHTACRYGHAGATRILISAKCDPNRTNLNGDTPLHIACAMGRRKLTRILLEAGANIDIKNAQNESPNDIAFRKKLTEISEILNSPIEIKPQKADRDRSSSNSKISKDKIDGQTTINHSTNKSKSNQRSDLVANPVNWSPYGCHYFPDPRTFPAPKLDTLPKEPLSTGEQYFLDLAGNIRKGPVGVGNTCYCGPFFRHIEERMSKNRKSLKKYVHKATERIDNKVQALAIKTDDQIEQLTKSMLAERIRCDGRRLHLEQWLRRGDPHRTTTAGYVNGTGGHFSKSKKNVENANTLTRCKSLELLGESQENIHKISNSKSFEVLDETQITVHHDADHIQSNEDINQSLTNSSSHRRNRNSSERSRSTGERIESRTDSQLFNKSGPENVSQRLEQLLAKTNEILIMEKNARRRNKAGLLLNGPESSHKNRNSKQYSSIYKPEDLKDKLKQISLSKSFPSPSNSNNSTNNPQFIENAMKKIATSLSYEQDEIQKYNNDPIQSFSPNMKDFPISQKELDRKLDQEHEKSSILSSSSHKNPSSIGSGYVADFGHVNNSQLRVSRNSKSANSDASSKLNPVEIRLENRLSHFDNFNINSPDEEVTGIDDRRFKTLISALKKDYRSTKDAIEAKIRKQNIENASSEDEDDEDNDESSFNQYHHHHHHHHPDDFHNIESCSEDDGDVDGSDYRHREKFYSPDNIDGSEKRSLSLGFFKNESFDDILNQQVNITSNENATKLHTIKDLDKTTNSELPEMTKANEITELKQRILNGSNWKNQMLRKTQQIFNLSGYSSNNNGNGNDESSTNGVMNKTEIRSSEIKNLKLTTNSSGVLKRSKVQELVAKIQGKDNHSTESQQNGFINSNGSIEFNDQKENIENFESEFSKSQSNYSDHLRITTPNNNIDSRNLVPKDAYFHEIPNKNQMRPIVDKLPEKQLLNFQTTYSRPISTNETYTQNVSPTLLACRTRNPLPYNITSGDYSNISQINNELCLDSRPYRNYIESNSKIATNEHSIVSHTIQNPILNKQNQSFPMPAVRTIHHHSHNQLQSNKSFNSIVQYKQNSIQSINEHYPVGTIDLITPEQAQFERDLSNDSGFSTKIGGSSLGPSPSLSGNNDYSLIQRNGIIASNLHNHSALENKINSSPVENTNNHQYYIGNTSSLV